MDLYIYIYKDFDIEMQVLTVLLNYYVFENILLKSANPFDLIMQSHKFKMSTKLGKYFLFFFLKKKKTYKMRVVRPN
jgi:hypothetical protein